MAHIFDDPEKLISRKVKLLLFSFFGFVLFLGLYLQTWLYPLVSPLYNRLVVVHLLHFVMAVVTCVVRHGVIKKEGMVIYVGLYLIAFVADCVACSIRTSLLVKWVDNANNVDKGIGIAMLTLEWLFVALCIIQLVNGAMINKATKKHLQHMDLLWLAVAYEKEPDSSTHEEITRIMESLHLRTVSDKNK